MHASQDMVHTHPLFNRFRAGKKGWKPLTRVQRDAVCAFERMIDAGELTYEAVHCPGCDGDSHRLLAQIDKYGAPQDVVICRGCGFVYNDPQLTQAAYIHFYDTVYRQMYMGYEQPVDDYFQEQYRERGQRHAAYIRDRLGLSFEGSLVVEIGCGSGGILQAFKELGADVLGFDFDSRFIEYGRANYDLDLRVQDFREYQANRSPGVVVLSNVLEHLLDPREKLAAIKRMMADDGVLFVEVPSLLRRRLGWSLQLAHVSYFTDHSLRYLLESEGFEMLDLCHHRTFINCLARPASTPKNTPLVSEYDEVLRFLVRQEKYGCLDYHKYNWYYPFTVGPIDLLMKAIRDPSRAFRVLSAKLGRQRFDDSAAPAVDTSRIPTTGAAREAARSEGAG